MSDKERQTQMEELRRRVVRTPNPHEGSKAVEALAAYGEEAIPKLLEVCDIATQDLSELLPSLAIEYLM